MKRTLSSVSPPASNETPDSTKTFPDTPDEQGPSEPQLSNRPVENSIELTAHESNSANDSVDEHTEPKMGTRSSNANAAVLPTTVNDYLENLKKSALLGNVDAQVRFQRCFRDVAGVRWVRQIRRRFLILWNQFFVMFREPHRLAYFYFDDCLASLSL